MKDESRPQDPAFVYDRIARQFHWWTVALVFMQIPVGVIMKRRGEGAVTDAMFNTHKLVGFTILLLVIARLIYRLVHVSPPHEPTIEPWQRFASRINHWALYALLLITALLGWTGVSFYGARDIFNIFRLPALVSENEHAAKFVFFLHAVAASVLVLLIAVHVGAAMYHHFIRKDGVLRRMLRVRWLAAHPDASTWKS
jgi:cytochrome b561